MNGEMFLCGLSGLLPDGNWPLRNLRIEGSWPVGFENRPAPGWCQFCSFIHCVQHVCKCLGLSNTWKQSNMCRYEVNEMAMKCGGKHIGSEREVESRLLML